MHLTDEIESEKRIYFGKRRQKKIPAGKKGGKPTGIRRGNLIDH